MSKFSVQNAVSGSVVYGNLRGDKSTDLQFIRTDATQVASGEASLIAGGGSNKASGYFSSVLGGFGNWASGNNSISGGTGNTSVGDTTLTIGGANLALSDQSVCIGLENRTEAEGSVAIGIGNVTYGLGSAIIGSQASATGPTAPYSLVLGGSSAFAYLPGQVVTNARGSQYSGGGTEPATLQASELMLMREQYFGPGTPGGSTFTSFALSLDGAAASLTNQVVMFGDDKAWHITVDYTIVDVTNSKIIAGKDLVIVDKQSNVVRLNTTNSITKIGDPAFVSQVSMAYTSVAPVNFIATVYAPSPFSVSTPTAFRATAKLKIVELKTS
jgi:hypothetical protein